MNRSALRSQPVVWWSPDRLEGPMATAVADCLVAAFGSGVWSSRPMPQANAEAILAELRGRERLVVASNADGELLGCVVGGVLDPSLIDGYRLGPFGAKTGDGLLAYIAVHPAAQGMGLASQLFSRFVALPSLAGCPHVFVRTRTVLRKIQHLAEANGFRYRGRFDVDFHGERQDRLVYARPRPLVAL